ncbi:kinase-like domain-containing protein [Coniochaeta sp. 2T2.1]|nr:kinase-like domain-containing protein [Coniochaeta sp. 2T2.1]
MEVIKAHQCFEVVDGGLKFVYTRVLFHKDGITFCAISLNRNTDSAICADQLKDIKAIPPEAYRPVLPPGCIIAPDPNRCYIKQPNLMSFGTGVDLASLVLQELAACEVIRKHPHLNIAKYYGCAVSDGRVTGLCFKWYPETLMDKINPGRLNKSTFISSNDRTAARKMAVRYLSGIEEAVRQLHALGLVHNDINPANVMITEDDRPVLIDFDSTCAPGTALDKTKRTYGWFDPDVRVSRERNDLDALAELNVWLTGSSPDCFQFEE